MRSMNTVAPITDNDNDSSNYNDMSFGGSARTGSEGSHMPRRAGSAHGSEDSATNVGQRARPNSIGSAESHRFEDLPGNPLFAVVRKVARFFNYFWSQGAVEQRIVEVVAIAGTDASEARLSQEGSLCGSAPGLFAPARPV